MTDLSGKSVLITGAGSGIGQASALAFARAGAGVTIADRDAASGNATLEMIEQAGGTAQFVCTDISRADEVTAMVAAAVARFGGLDFAHNNAGVETALAPVAEADEADWDRSMAINLKGVWLSMRAEIPHMLATGGGAIVNTASVAGLTAAPMAGAYAAAKHGVVGISRTAAVEYAEQGIRVNALCPGLTRTGMTDRLNALAPGMLDSLTPAMNRFASPEEIAAVALFLCSDAASYLTGQAIAVDGGATAI
ncbi:glucose 1-dehydrogenase [Altererythrobacter sp.]|uniref:glucose 1-dehydrogenase n=1 Tax=Altererythrobacter sp. TaxID=1872480 RepID=UPI003D0BDC78